MTGLGKAPESVAILGSGALPETGVWMIDWARKNNKRIRIHSLEIIPERLEQSRRVYEALSLLDDLTFEVGDVRTAPKDLSSFDVVYFNATLGTTTREKEDLMLDVAGRMRPGALVLTRSTYSLKTMAYPVSLGISFVYRLSTYLIYRILTCRAPSACRNTIVTYNEQA